MARMVHCVKLGREAEGLDFPPVPGELGKRIWENVSKEAWLAWQKHQTMLVNENRLNLADARARKYLLTQMESYFLARGPTRWRAMLLRPQSDMNALSIRAKWFIQCIGAAVIGISIAGCTVKSLKTSGVLETEQSIRNLRVEYVPVLPKQMKISRASQFYTPTITETDRNIARSNAQKLNQVFTNGFKSRFPKIAKQYGLSVSDARADIHVLRVSVTAADTSCSDMGCQSVFGLQGDLYDKESKTIWSFTARVGQPVVNVQISAEIFDSFSKDLLDKMKADRLLP